MTTRQLAKLMLTIGSVTLLVGLVLSISVVPDTTSSGGYAINATDCANCHEVTELDWQIAPNNLLITLESLGDIYATPDSEHPDISGYHSGGGWTARRARGR